MFGFGGFVFEIRSPVAQDGSYVAETNLGLLTSTPQVLNL